MNFEGLIFDLDGVIVSTEQNHYESWSLIASELDLEFNEEINELLKGISRRDCLRILLERSNKSLADKEFEEALVRKNVFYKKSIEKLGSEAVLPGVMKTITKAKAKGKKLMVGSSSRNARYILDRLNMTYLFDHIVDGNDVMNPKPDPEVFLKGAELANLTPAQCIVFEDAESGIVAAKNGGFQVVGVGNPNIMDTVENYFNTLEEFYF